jgi:hypothetical protein
MPEFDTYHILERFAKDNASTETRQAYLFLKRRTELSIQWKAISRAELAPIDKLADIYMGTKANKQSTNLGAMSEEERQDLFKKACAQVGVKIDPKIFTKTNNKAG